MSGSGVEVPRQRLVLASKALGGLLELLDAAGPERKLDPSGLRALLVPAVCEVKEAERELRMVS